MSARNWQVCPNCLRKRKAADHKQAAKDKAELDDAYKRLPRDQYEALAAFMREERKKAKPPDETMREDGDVYMTDEGEFVASLRFSCQSCGWQFDFDHKEQALKGEAERGEAG